MPPADKDKAGYAECSAAGLIGFGDLDDSMERFMYRKVFTSKVFERKVGVITGGCAGSTTHNTGV